VAAPGSVGEVVGSVATGPGSGAAGDGALGGSLGEGDSPIAGGSVAAGGSLGEGESPVADGSLAGGGSLVAAGSDGGSLAVGGSLAAGGSDGGSLAVGGSLAAGGSDGGSLAAGGLEVVVVGVSETGVETVASGGGSVAGVASVGGGSTTCDGSVTVAGSWAPAVAVNAVATRSRAASATSTRRNAGRFGRSAQDAQTPLQLEAATLPYGKGPQFPRICSAAILSSEEERESAIRKIVR
jgi:hypothetical protein